VASALGGTFFRKCELILARDSAFDKIAPDSSVSPSFGLYCSPPVTKTINLFY
jgi:hypothetical protein